MIKELVENYLKASNELADATGLIVYLPGLQCSAQGL